MQKKLDYKHLKDLLEARRYQEFLTAASAENAVDMAQFIASLPVDKTAVAFRMLPKELASDVFSSIPPDTRRVVISAITDIELSEIIDGMFTDDAVDMLEELPAGVVKRILKNAAPEKRGILNKFLKYPDNSAGSIMTAEFVELKKDMSAGEAVAHIRKTALACESIYTCYVMGETRVLEGVVSLRELVLADDCELLESLMERNVITACTTEDREEAAGRLARYGLLSLPVVDSEGRLVGVVTADDVMDVMEEEATEDFEKMAAVSPMNEPYLRTGVLDMTKSRILWLMLLMVSGMITGGVLEKYESAFSAVPLLVTFIPMLTDTGGNAGSQSSALVIRGMAVGEINTRDFLKIFWKELRVSALAGAVLGALNYVRIAVMYPASRGICVTVTLSLLLTVMLAKTVGGVLPVAAKFMRADPAVMAAPLITTVVDAMALIIYFSIARRLLHI